MTAAEPEWRGHCGVMRCVPTPPLPFLLNPSPLDQAAAFQLVEQGVERRDMKADDTVRLLLDDLRDVVSVAGPSLEHRQDQRLGAAFAKRRGKCVIHICDRYISSRAKRVKGRFGLDVGPLGRM